MLKVIDWIYERQWAITPHALETIVQVVETPLNMDASEYKIVRERLEAISTEPGDPLPGTHTASLRGRTAVIPVFGPIVPRAGLFTIMSGATSCETIAHDFRAAMDSPKVDSILFYVDSPGGEITGLSELSSMIYNARGDKPILTYAMGQIASGAYWIGSASDEIIISETSLVGSIGVVALLQDTSKREEKSGIVTRTFVSSVSPLKRPDMNSPEGIDKVQRLVDAAAGVFIEQVARNRGTNEETVKADFGQGDVLTGALAVGQGLADRLGSYEGILSELNSDSSNKQGGLFMSGKEKTGEGVVVSMTVEALKENHLAVYNEVFEAGRQAGSTEEIERIQSIESLSSVPGSEQVIADNKFKAGMTKDQVSTLILNSQEERRQEALAAREKDQKDQKDKMAGTGLVTDDKDPQQEALQKAMNDGINGN